MPTPTFEDLAAGGTETADVLASLFAQRGADEWEWLLGEAGVGCARADRYLPSEFWLEDPQARALGLTTEAVHPAWGVYRRHGPMVRFDRQPPTLSGPPLAGQHNETVLGARGYGVDDIARLRDEGVLWGEASA
jgi:crotonobetainyl-CoA:carnitine CoA-transferase CaiB-like acyl-CoA transferase